MPFLSALLQQLPTHLRRALLRDIGAARGGGTHLLEGLPNECIGAVASRLIYVVFCEGDVVYERNERADRMFFVVSGSISLCWAPASSAEGTEKRKADGNQTLSSPPPWASRIIVPGETLGELALRNLAEQALLGAGEDPPPAPPRRESAVALGRVCLLTLMAEDAKSLMEDYPAFARRLRDIGAVRETECRAMAAGFAAAGSEYGGATTIRADAEENEEAGRRFRAYLGRQRTDLLRRQESRLLEPLTAFEGPGGEPLTIMRLLLRVHSANAVAAGTSSGEGGRSASSTQVPVAAEWRGLSCLVTRQGELLYFEHTDAGLTEAAPRSLGFIVPRQSKFRHLGRSRSSASLGNSKQSERTGLKVSNQGNEDGLSAGLLVFDTPGTASTQVTSAVHGGTAEKQETAAASGPGRWLLFKARSLHQFRVLQAAVTESIGRNSRSSCSRKLSVVSAAAAVGISETLGAVADREEQKEDDEEEEDDEDEVVVEEEDFDPFAEENGSRTHCGHGGGGEGIGVPSNKSVNISGKSAYPVAFLSLWPSAAEATSGDRNFARLIVADVQESGCTVETVLPRANDEATVLQLDLLWEEHCRLRDQLVAAGATIAHARRNLQLRNQTLMSKQKCTMAVDILPEPGSNQPISELPWGRC
jgi:CRP-like cAMP-binding protein